MTSMVATRGRLVGREPEIGALRDALVAVAGGRGGLVMIDGEPGIGKSTLLAAAFADAPALGCELLRGAADELSQRFPLRMMLECLQTASRRADRYRARIMARLSEWRPAGLPGEDDPFPVAIELVLHLIDQLCAASPVVLVIDDLQWIDEVSLLLWRRLARDAHRQPLLLVGAHGPVPRRAELAELTRAVSDHHGLSMTLQPLPEAAVTELVTQLVGAPPGVELSRLSGQAAGNPLYLRELIEALVRESAIEIVDGRAELTRAGFWRPASLTAAVERRLELLSTEAVTVFRWAALLGQEFTVADLAVVAGRPPAELAGVVANAVAAGVVAETAAGLRFRHLLTHRALYEGMPRAMRVALHRQAARALAEAGRCAERVAEQLILAPSAVDGWVVGWVAGEGKTLARRAPLIAFELIERSLAHCPVDDPAREALTAQLAVVLFRMGRTGPAAARARQVLAATRDPARAAQMRWILGYVLLREARIDDALDTLGQALADPDAPPVWAARLQALRSLVLANAWRDPEATIRAAERAIEMGERTGDPLTVGQALRSLGCVHLARRDHPRALASVDRALAVLGDDTDYPQLRAALLDHRVFILQNLDRLTEAEATLRTMSDLADRTQDAYRSRVRLSAGVHHYWAGRWDDALAALEEAAADLAAATGLGPAARPARLLLHGCAALIAGHRDDRAGCRAHLAAGAECGIGSAADRDHSDFLLAAQALAAERGGSPAEALAAFGPLLDPAYGHTLLRHQWLPDIVRVALEVDDPAAARAALKICEAEAVRESSPARAAAALARCRGLIDGDVAALRGAADHYRDVGRPVELAQTLEDLAVVLAARAAGGPARRCLDEAVELYTRQGAGWDIRRAQTRLRRYGVRRGADGPRRRRDGSGSGWGALTATELKVARLVADGRSNPQIAAELFLSPRTVQSHVQHILTKLDVHSRVDIARLAIAADRPH